MNEITNTKPTSIQSLLDNPAMKERIQSVLASKANTFTASVLSLVNSNTNLKTCDPNTVFIAALTSASLDLPINQNLGYAYIIPYKDRDKGMVAQFQLGYKGMLQLAQRSGQFKTINATEVREGEIRDYNRMTGDIDFEWKQDNRDKLPVVGYLAYFKLLNGFEKTLYMTVDEVKKHGGKYSQTFKKGFGVWVDDFDAMAKKTVIKLLISRYAPMSIEMTRATISDQAVLRDIDEPEYIDNRQETIAEVAENNRVATIIKAIETAKTLEDLELVESDITSENLSAIYEAKRKDLTK